MAGNDARTSRTCLCGQIGIVDAASVLLPHCFEHAVIGKNGLPRYQQALKGGPDLSRTTSWLPGTEPDTAWVGSKDGDDDIPHTALGVHVALSPPDCGMSHIKVGVHIVSPPADCGAQPSSPSLPGSEDELQCDC